MSNDGAFSETVLLLIMPVGLYFGVMWSNVNKTKNNPMIRMPAENIVVGSFCSFHRPFISARHVSCFPCTLLFYLSSYYYFYFTFWVLTYHLVFEVNSVWYATSIFFLYVLRISALYTRRPIDWSIFSVHSINSHSLSLLYLF